MWLLSYTDTFTAAEAQLFMPMLTPPEQRYCRHKSLLTGWKVHQLQWCLLYISSKGF